MSSPGRTSRIAIPGGGSVSSPAGRPSPGPSGSCAGSCTPRSGSVGGRVSRGRGTAGRRSRSRSFRFGRAYFRGGCARLMLSYSHSCSHGEQQHKHERIPENVFTLRHKIHRDSWRSNPIVTSASAAFQRHWLFFEGLDTWSQSRRRRLTPWGVAVGLRNRSARSLAQSLAPHRRLLAAILIPATGQVKTNPGWDMRLPRCAFFAIP